MTTSPPTPSPRLRLAVLSVACLLVGLLMAVGAKGLLWLIAVVTNLAYYGRFSAEAVTPAGHALGAWAILVPAAGGLIVGLLARYGSRAIQGHGIPEAMEQVLLNGSRIPPKVLLLKPLSTSVVIGTGGPFGAEGVVIATGGALGSLLGQRFKATPIERKTLLAAGAAAGLSAAFSCPLAGVLLAVELLLFEFHPRSLIPVALASAAAAAARVPLLGPGPMFAMPPLGGGSTQALGACLLLGCAAGVAATAVVRLVHLVEEAFEHAPVPWMWKPALGGLGVGFIGWLDPRVLGPGYPDIEALLGGGVSAAAAVRLGALKLSAWVIGVGSATASGTLAPLLLIGSSVGLAASRVFGALLDPRVAALVGMSAFFGGMSGAFLASVILALEACYQPALIMPLLAGTAASYLVCRLLSRETIMTQKFVRQGVAVPTGIVANPLDWMHVAEAVARPEVPADLAARLMERGAVVAENATLREASERMIQQDEDALAVLSYDDAGRVVGLLTLRDVLAACRHEDERADASRLPKLRFLASPKKRPHKAP